MTPDPRESQDPQDPRMSSKKLQFYYLPYLHVALPEPAQIHPAGLRAALEGLQEPQEGLEELIFDDISVTWVQN